MAEVIKRIATQLDQSMTERDQVILGYMKHCFPDSAKRRRPSLLKVLARDHSIYVTTPDVDKWKKNYDRRQELLHSGFFTPNNRPYQCVGQLILDNQELLSRCLSPEKQEGLTKLLAKKYHTASSGQMRINIGKKKVGYIPGLFSKHCHPTYRDGYQHIKNYRNELQKIHNAVASNQGLSSCLTVQKVDVPLSQRKSPRGLSQEETKSLSGKQEKSSSLKETLSNFLETEPDDPEEREQLRIYHRNHEYILEKLQVIFMLLCGITSMKAVDLKTLKPLSQEQVKIFTKDILIGKKSICYFVPPPSYIKKTSHYSEGPALEDLQFITPENTWESLLNEKALCFRKSDSKSKPSRSLGSGRSLTANARRIRMALKDSEFKADDLPPWLAFLWDQYDVSDMSGGRFSLEDKTACIRKQRAIFHDLQNSMNKSTYQTMREKKRYETGRMKVLLESINLRPNTHKNSFLSSLKNITKSQKPLENPPLWFTELENKCLDFLGDVDDEINNQLQKVKYFHRMTPYSLLFAKEKLCLLTMSLSVLKLLRPVVQDALIFIMEDILQQPSEQLKNWYKYRKLPFIALI